MNDAEYDFQKPTIFDRPDLSWLRYGETRHIPGQNLSGNVGNSASVLNTKNFEHLKPAGISYDDWVEQEVKAAANRVNALKESCGFDTLSRPVPVHGTATIDLDKDSALVDYTLPQAERAQADATILTQEGSATMVAPADCIVATVAFPEEKAVGQIHIGFQGAVKDIVTTALGSFKENGLDISRALVYMSPHVQSGFPLTDGQDEILHELTNKTSNEQRELVLSNVSNRDGIAVMNLTNLALSEFKRAGVDKDHIEVSPIDTFSSDRVFSEYKARTDQSRDGRFAVMVGIKK